MRSITLSLGKFQGKWKRRRIKEDSSECSGCPGLQVVIRSASASNCDCEGPPAQTQEVAVRPGRPLIVGPLVCAALSYVPTLYYLPLKCPLER